MKKSIIKSFIALGLCIYFKQYTMEHKTQLSLEEIRKQHHQNQLHVLRSRPLEKYSLDSLFTTLLENFNSPLPSKKDSSITDIYFARSVKTNNYHLILEQNNEKWYVFDRRKQTYIFEKKEDFSHCFLLSNQMNTNKKTLPFCIDDTKIIFSDDKLMAKNYDNQIINAHITKDKKLVLLRKNEKVTINITDSSSELSLFIDEDVDTIVWNGKNYILIKQGEKPTMIFISPIYENNNLKAIPIKNLHSIIAISPCNQFIVITKKETIKDHSLLDPYEKIITYLYNTLDNSTQKIIDETVIQATFNVQDDIVAVLTEKKNVYMYPLNSQDIVAHLQQKSRNHTTFEKFLYAAIKDEDYSPQLKYYSTTFSTLHEKKLQQLSWLFDFSAYYEAIETEKNLEEKTKKKLEEKTLKSSTPDPSNSNRNESSINSSNFRTIPIPLQKLFNHLGSFIYSYKKIISGVAFLGFALVMFNRYISNTDIKYAFLG